MDYILDQKSASSSHSLSDSEEEEEREEEEREEEERKKPEKRRQAIPTTEEKEMEKRVKIMGSNAQPQTDTKKTRPVCKYGVACYRKNPDHLREFEHPHKEKGGGGGGGGGRGRGGRGGGEKSGLGDSSAVKGSEDKREEGKRKNAQRGERREEEEEEEEGEEGGREIAMRKKIKLADSRDPFPVRASSSVPFCLFLNKCFSVKGTESDPLTLVFPDLLHPDHGTLLESAQLSFLVQLDFLMSAYSHAKAAGKPLLLVCGQVEGDPQLYPGLTCLKAFMPYPYGHHHTKAMFLLYQEGLRVVVHTANLVEDDWYEKTQGYWVSPLFPPLEEGKSSVLHGESSTRFKKDLIEYLQAYKLPQLNRWAAIVKRHDFSECNVFLVGSVPGYHTGGQLELWGHCKVRKVIGQHSTPLQHQRSHPPTTIMQCSSIGSLGKDFRSWLGGELGLSMAGHKSIGPPLPATLPKVCVMYPSEDDVRNSSQGWEGGSCLPYHTTTHQRQPWLTQHLRAWRSDSRKRTRSMPHIKTYTQVTHDLQSASFLLLSSANISKAAWGCLQKDSTQLFIRSYELGVLLLPKFVTGTTEFSLDPSRPDPLLPLPYDLPLTPYPPAAVPWFADTPKEEEDMFGQTYSLSS